MRGLNEIDQLIKLSHSVSKYCVGMEGNVSMKIDDGFLIKASGAKLESLTKSDLVRLDFNKNQKDNFERKPSMEIGFHSYLLQQDGINFVAHTHPVNTLKILCTDEITTFGNSRMFPDQVVFNGSRSCVVPYAKPGEDLNDLIKSKVKNFIETYGEFPNLILMMNHGIIVSGKTIDECITITDICEKSAKIFIGSKMLGNQKFLTKIQIGDLVLDDKEKYRKSLL